MNHWHARHSLLYSKTTLIEGCIPLRLGVVYVYTKV